MSLQTWQELLYSGTGDATAIATSTTETILVPDFTLAANYLYAGRTLRQIVYGRISTVVAAPGTLTIRLRYGGVAGTLLVASAAVALNTAAQVSDTFELEFITVCRAVGTAGTLLTTGMLNLGPAAATNVINMLPATAPAAVAVNTTTANAMSITAEFSVSSASNSIQAHNYLFEALN